MTLNGTSHLIHIEFCEVIKTAKKSTSGPFAISDNLEFRTSDIVMIENPDDVVFLMN